MSQPICPAIQTTWPIHRPCFLFVQPGKKYCLLHEIQTNVNDFIPTRTIEQGRHPRRTFNPILNVPIVGLTLTPLADGFPIQDSITELK